MALGTKVFKKHIVFIVFWTPVDTLHSPWVSINQATAQFCQNVYALQP